MNKFYSASFARGFARGVASPYSYIYSKPKRYSRVRRGTVALSWAIVGGLLSNAMAAEAENIEQITQKDRHGSQTGRGIT